MEVIAYSQFISPELQPLGDKLRLDFVPEMMVVLGRGIEKSVEGGWRPTRLVEKGIGKRLSHTGELDWDISGTGENDVIGGGNANVIALQKCLVAYHDQHRNLPNIIFAAGQPDYLSTKGISEGEVMSAKLKRLLPQEIASQLSIQILKTNKNTHDDVLNSLLDASRGGARSIVFMTISPHLPRTWEMTKKILFENRSQLSAKFDSISFIDSWEVLMNDKSGGYRYKKIIELLKKLKAYQNTTSLEESGIKALKEDKY